MVRDRRWVGERVERLNAGLRDGIRVTAPRDRADAESRRDALSQLRPRLVLTS